MSVSESASIGSIVGTFTATDPRSLPLTYSIQAAPPPRDFLLNSMNNRGVLTVACELDYETVPRYQFTVGVENSDSYRDSIDVIVDIINVDDIPTWCSESVTFFSVVEEQMTADLQLPACTDGDIPSSPSFDYSIIAGNETGLFLINGGNVSIMRPLDYETQTLHDLSVQVVQSGGSLGFNMTVIVEVVPVNEYTPQFQSTSIDFTVQESALIASTVGAISATDDDTGDDGTIVYSILSQTLHNFAIHPNTGEVIVTRSLDFETMPQSFTFNVIARDNPTVGGAQRSSTVQVRISIQDVNDNRPHFSSHIFYTRVNEQSNVGHEVLHLQCDDLDSGVNQEVTYSIDAGNNEGKFRINSTSGQVVLDSALNYEGNNTQFYNLTIECQEVEPPRGKAQASLLVSVESFNEFSPDPGANYMASVSEDTRPGTSILRVHGRDRDRGPAGTLMYFINEDNSQYCPNGTFYMDRYTGEIYLSSLLDYETGLRTIFCTILVWDSEVPRKSAGADLIVTVTNTNDVPPVCVPPVLNATVSEDSQIGHEVIALSCSDADSPLLSYSILEEEQAPFRISSAGVLVVNRSLDYETNSTYRISIEVSDGEFFYNITVFVYITGVNEHSPIFSEAVTVCNVDENEPLGTLACIVSASDDDSGLDGVLHYRISSGGSNPSDIFVVDRESGQIYLSANVDHEAESNFTFLVEAYDLGEPSLTSTTSVIINVIDLNDNPPQMDSFTSLTVSENAAMGEMVGILDCTDLDSGNNAQITLTLKSIVKVHKNGTATLTAGAPFDLDSTTGSLSVSGSLDYEMDRLYRLSIVCRDNGIPSLATFSTVSVLVQAENEFTPSFRQSEYSVDVSENTTIGSSILVISASDDDDDVQGLVSFSILALDGHPFSINPQSGIIVLTSVLDCLQNVTYTLTVVAQDGGSPPLQSQVDVFVNVVGCHLGDLIPQRIVSVGSVEENSPADTSILTVACDSTRSSLGLSYSPRYRIAEGDTSLFQINENSGMVTVSSPPDFEASAYHLLNVLCFDENNAQVSASTSTLISVTPVNEHDPEFTEDSYTFSIQEGSPLGSVAFAISASDLDNGGDGEITYSIEGDNSSQFFIDGHTGEVYLSVTLDRESQNELRLVAVASDNPEDAASRRSSSVTVNIQVTDSNDHWPQCNRTVYHVIVSPRSEQGSMILSDLGCSDVDLGLNGKLEYAFTDDTSSDLFNLDRDEGRLTLVGTLDPEDSVAHQVSVEVRDLGIPSLSTFVLVVVDVQEPPIDTSLSDGDHASHLEDEGLKNAVTITLNDVSYSLVSSIMIIVTYLIPCTISTHTCIVGYIRCSHQLSRCRC